MSKTAKDILQDIVTGKATKDDLTSSAGQSKFTIQAIEEGRVFESKSGEQITANDIREGFKRFEFPFSVNIYDENEL